MIQGNDNILKLIETKRISIKPFKEELLQGVSYDLRLDEYFVFPFQNHYDVKNKYIEYWKKTISNCYFDFGRHETEEDNIRKFGIQCVNPALDSNETVQAVEQKEDIDLEKFINDFISFNILSKNPNTGWRYNSCFISDHFILLPKQRVLASTIEKAGSTSLDITTKIFSKSSWARHGLEVASCAGYGDPHYCNHWTLEIFNKNEYPVVLQKGMVIAQIAFEKVEGCTKEYKSKYNNEGVDKAYSDYDRFGMMTPKKIKIV